METSPLDNASPLRNPARLMAFFLPIAALICVSLFFIYKTEANSVHSQHAQDAHEVVSVGAESITRTLKWITRDLRYLSDDTGMQQLLDDPDKRHMNNLAADWVSFSQNKQVYDKIRWIDETGMERLRINMARPKPYVVPKNELQFKRNRYFFADTFKLKAGEIFVSPFDLNFERGSIEIPYKPTIRMGMPVFDSKGTKRGILLINYLAKDLLANFSSSFQAKKWSGWLVNQKGYWLKGSKGADEFGFMFNRDDLTIAQRYPEAWGKISRTESGQFNTPEGLWTFSTVYPLLEGLKSKADCDNITTVQCKKSDLLYSWKAVHLMPADEYNAGLVAFGLKLGGSAILLLGLFFAGSWRVVRAHQIEKNVRENLEQIVEERTHDLTLANQSLTESETRTRTLLHTIPDLIWLKDKDGVYLDCNPALEELFDAKRSEIIGKTSDEFVGEEQTEAFHSSDLEVIKENKPIVLEEWITYRKTDRQALFEVIKVPMQTVNGQLIGVLGIGRDITERKQAEERLQLAAMVYQHSSQAILVTDENGIIIAVNPGFERITGYSAEEAVGNNANIVSSGRHDRAFYQAMWHSLTTTGRWQGEIWNRRKNGQLYPAWNTINAIFKEDGTIGRYVELCSDFTKKKETEHLLWQQTNFDPLTGMPNRHMFMEYLEQETKNSQQAELPLALMFLDLDHFKDVNDTLGHDMGDIMLKDASERIKDCVRESDIVAHLGGDDFTIILSSLENVSTVEHVADAILKRIAEPFSLEDEIVHITASIGVSMYPDDAADPDSLLKNTEQAMYAAKKAGRNRCNYFTSTMQDAAQVRLRLVNDLRNALPANQFKVVYQPIADLTTGDIHKAESLIRWQHPVRGLISPAEFINIAEEIEVIADLGNWVFQEAAHQSMRWRASLQPDFQVSVNMSPLQFRSDGISHIGWFDFLRRLGIPGEGIVIEITEGLLMEVDKSISAQLLAFRDAGMQVAIDDFGTGYSSLSYIKKFDIDYLKIDQSFVRNLMPNSSDLALCEAIIVMAHKLGIKVIAEGVETEIQRDLLIEAGCDFGQGVLFSKPLNAADFELLLRENVAQHKKEEDTETS